MRLPVVCTINDTWVRRSDCVPYTSASSPAPSTQSQTRREYFDRPYDFALSFSGSERAIAERLRHLLSERQLAVFYDNDEQHRIIAEDVEDYLVPIYKTEAMFVLPILSPTYPTRIWAKIESDAFKERFGQSAVIPIKLSTVQEGFFNDYMRYGYLALDMSGDIEAQLIKIADTLGRRMLDERAQSANEAVAAEA